MNEDFLGLLEGVVVEREAGEEPRVGVKHPLSQPDQCAPIRHHRRLVEIPEMGMRIQETVTQERLGKHVGRCIEEPEHLDRGNDRGVRVARGSDGDEKAVTLGIIELAGPFRAHRDDQVSQLVALEPLDDFDVGPRAVQLAADDLFEIQATDLVDGQPAVVQDGIEVQPGQFADRQKHHFDWAADHSPLWGNFLGVGEWGEIGADAEIGIARQRILGQLAETGEPPISRQEKAFVLDFRLSHTPSGRKYRGPFSDIADQSHLAKYFGARLEEARRPQPLVEALGG
jgi:hypothetical protein